MDLLDILLIAAVIGYSVRGYYTGFFRQAGALGGFIVGLSLGSWLATYTTGLANSTNGKTFAALATILGLAVIVGSVGELGGNALAKVAHKLHVDMADEIAGAVLSVVSLLLVVWVLGSILAKLPFDNLASQVQHSLVLRSLDADLPPVPDVIARVEQLIAPNGFPQVFAGIEPIAGPPVTEPTDAQVAAAAAAGRASTVKIESVGCGGLVDGTGFVIAPNLIATNAHVVAGTHNTHVVDGAGEHAAVVVSFDPNLDFAVLRTTGLNDTPLVLSSKEYPRGTGGAVLGYPGGGAFSIQPAAILYEQNALGRNIYDHGLVNRKIYALQAIIRPGNSGGPLIMPDGTVIGVVFADSTTNNDVGYALTSASVSNEAGLAANSGPVDNGDCAAE